MIGPKIGKFVVDFDLIGGGTSKVSSGRTIMGSMYVLPPPIMASPPSMPDADAAATVSSTKLALVVLYARIQHKTSNRNKTVFVNDNDNDAVERVMMINIEKRSMGVD